MEKDTFSDRLKRLEHRLEAARSGRTPPPSRHRGEFTQGSLAWRMVTELVVGMLLGLAVGFGLDRLAGTGPLFLILFVLLGFGGGVRTMMRTAEEVRGRRAEGALLGDKDNGGGVDAPEPDRTGGRD